MNEIVSQSGGVNRTLSYDLNGSITSDGGARTFEWDGANRLVAINYTGFTTRSEFSYDGLSRVAKIVEKTGATINSTRKIVWCGNTVCEFRSASDSVTDRLYSQGQNIGNTAYYYTRDHLGSVRELAKSGGSTIVARYDYDPFGRSTTIVGTTPTDLNFTGLSRHSKSNLDLAVYRAYDPDLGRWLSRDLIGETGSDGPNLYGYVRNDPVNRIDPLGLDSYLMDVSDTMVRLLQRLFRCLRLAAGMVRVKKSSTSAAALVKWTDRALGLKGLAKAGNQSGAWRVVRLAGKDAWLDKDEGEPGLERC